MYLLKYKLTIILAVQFSSVTFFSTSTGTELEDDLLDDKLNADDGTSSTHTEVAYPRSVPSNVAGSSQVSEGFPFI